MSKIIDKIIIPTWYYLSASVESLFFLSQKKKSLEILKLAKENINNTRDLVDWYEKNDFDYFSDKFDLSSLPWVVITKKGGDCDDFMSLTYEILKTKFKCYKVLIYSYDKRAHAITVIKENDDYVIMSNMTKIKGFNSLEKAAKYFYGNNTKKIRYLN